MKILFLGNKDLELYDWLIATGEDVTFITDKVSFKDIAYLKPGMIISHGYQYIITKDIIQHMKGNIVNLHISYLPWNRGSSPNLWSFIDDTKKGVTVHFIDEGIDTGDIILQKELYFDENVETLKTTYNSLQRELKKMFKDNWKDILNNNIHRLPQDKKDGSIHYDKQSNNFIKLKEEILWDLPITELKLKKIL